MALIEITPMRPRGRVAVDPNYYIGVSTARRENIKKGKAQTVFMLSAKAMTDMRWVCGDFVKVLIDQDTNEVHLRRCAPNERGFKLSPSGALAKDGFGKPLASTFRTSDQRLTHVALISMQKDDCYIENNDLVFVYPVPFNLPQSAKEPPASEASPLLYPASFANRTSTPRNAARR